VFLEIFRDCIIDAFSDHIAVLEIPVAGLAEPL
jgi:hypothetical protein